MPLYRTSGKILVVDDEPLIRIYLRDIIEAYGFTAVEAGDADAFYEVVAKDNDRRRICGLSPIYTILSLLGQ